MAQRISRQRAQCLSDFFFGRFRFLLQRVSTTGENCREMCFHYACMYQQTVGKHNKKRFSSCCYSYFRRYSEWFKIDFQWIVNNFFFFTSLLFEFECASCGEFYSISFFLFCCSFLTCNSEYPRLWLGFIKSCWFLLSAEEKRNETIRVR